MKIKFLSEANKEYRFQYQANFDFHHPASTACASCSSGWSECCISSMSILTWIEVPCIKKKKSLQFRRVEESESDNLFHDHIQGEDENAEDVQMADHLRPMEELLQIPIVGIEDAIVVPAVLANEFELKIELLDFISNNPFFGLENDDPHSHIKRFYQITRTFKINQVPHDVVKLILFPFSLKGAAETWLENEPPCSITTWDDLVSKFLNRFYPHSKTRELRKEITNFQQVSAGGNLMSKNTQEALTIIENKAKVRTFRNKPQVLSNDGTSTQIDAIAALSKQVEALGYHIASMQETNNRNQEATIQLMQNQMGQMAEAFQERPLENPTGRAEHFVYRIDIVDSLCDKFPIENNSLSGNPTHSSDSVVKSLSLLPNPCGDSDSLVEETDTFLSYFNDSSPDYETFCFDIEEKSSGSTTSHSDLSLPEYEMFHFDLSIDPPPPGDRSDSHCNTPKMGRSGIRIRGVLLQDQQHKIYIRTTQKVV
ncbi:reverse transcriptase domain-containing protein [Tanacetum coccineum]|uniref:Reverse transcriptase domain-containing protein n=1 Tax=Tanacetum coccineum TaxID=301880 RepID=A0ABQ5CBL2_9ASTR